jgi:hypothetical protein
MFQLLYETSIFIIRYVLIYYSLALALNYLFHNLWKQYFQVLWVYTHMYGI